MPGEVFEQSWAEQPTGSIDMGTPEFRKRIVLIKRCKNFNKTMEGAHKGLPGSKNQEKSRLSLSKAVGAHYHERT